jgi:hypothetical protein
MPKVDWIPFSFPACRCPVYYRSGTVCDEYFFWIKDIAQHSPHGSAVTDVQILSILKLKLSAPQHLSDCRTLSLFGVGYSLFMPDNDCAKIA